MPYLRGSVYPVRVSSDELSTVFSERRRALRDATCFATGNGPLPVAWRHGWKASVAILGRDKDGSLLVAIRCKGPESANTYSRRIRLVPRKGLCTG